MGYLCSEEFPLMEVWNGWEFLNFTGLMGPHGLLISLLSVLSGETEVPPPIRTGEVNLGRLLEVFLSRGIVLYVSLRFTTVGSSKTRVPLHAASVPIFFETILWHACKVPILSATPPTIGGSIGRMMTGMVRLINNFC